MDALEAQITLDTTSYPKEEYSFAYSHAKVGLHAKLKDL